MLSITSLFLIMNGKGDETMDDSENKSKRRHWAMRFVLSKGFIIAIAIVVVYTLSGFFLVPYLINRYATRFADETLRCRLIMEEVRVNPYALTLDIKKFDLKETNGSPLMAFEELFANFQVSSLWRWAFTFADVRLEKPSLHIEVMADGGINLIDLVDRIPKEEDTTGSKGKKSGEKGETLPRLVLDHIALNEGRLVFTDLSNATHASVNLEPLSLELKNFTTLPDKKGMHSFEATLPHGGTFRWTGEMSTRPLWSEGNIAVKGFNVATAWEFLQDEILVGKPEGKVDFSAAYRFAHGGGSTSLLMDDIGALISGISLKRSGTEEPMFTMDSIQIDQGRFDLATRELSVGQLALSRGSVAATVNEQGELNFQEIVAVAPQTSSTSTGKEESEVPPWGVDFKHIDLESVSLKYIDRSRAYPTEIKTDNLGMKLQARLSYGPQKMQTIVDNMDITFSAVSLKEIAQGDPIVHLNKIFVGGGRLDLEARQLDVAKVALEGGHARLSKEKEGAINLARVLGGVGKGKMVREVAAMNKEAKDDMKPWAIAVGSAEMTGFGVAFTDQGLSPYQTIDIENLVLKVSDIKSDFKDPVPFEASLAVRQGGSMNAKGRLTLAEKSAEAEIQVSNLALTPIQPYLAQVVFLALESGAFSLKGNVTYKEDNNGPHTTFIGSAGIRNLLVSESKTNQRFLSWKEMEVNDMTLGLGPDLLEVGEVRLKEAYGKLIIFEDQSVNLKKVLRPQEAKVEQDKPASRGKTPGGFPVNIRKIRIDKGGLDFADLSLRPQFAAKIHELKGAVVGISTKKGERAQVQLNGRVDAYGTSKIQGELEPFNIKRFTDISMIFRNVEMTNLTPYSAKFAGYKIASGKLSLDLRYLINNSELQGENQIILDKLTLGEKIDNPDAPDLPLELALALLKDADDRIDIGLPVSGNLDDPQFKYSHLIWKALLNLFKKIITSPFKALSAMLGVEDEKLDVIEFELGKTVLSPPEQEKVNNISEALAKRPQLMLKIEGGYDPAGDGAAMKSFAVRREIAKKMGRKIAPGEEPEPVDVNDPLVQKAIEDLVKERVSPQALETAKKNASTRAAEAVKKEPIQGISHLYVPLKFWSWQADRMFLAI
ncbi:MAG: DUF748 domain-containing protein [Candidatus Desulfacyla sp.]